MSDEIKPLKALQPLGKLQRKVLFVMIHAQEKMPIRDIADFIHGKNQHTANQRKTIRKALKGLRRRRLTFYRYEHAESHIMGEWRLTSLGLDLNVEGMVHYWKTENPAWFDEVISRLPPEGFFKTLNYEREVDP